MIVMYRLISVIVRAIIWLINGKINVCGKENIPKNEKFILVAPHRTWWDPVWFAIVMWPMRFIFMAKKELFKNKFLGWFISGLGAFSVDREHAGPSAIRIPVQELKTGSRSFMIFPSGSRHSSQLEGGAIVIAKMSGKSLLPVVYQGPLQFKGLFKRGSTSVAIGPAITVDRHADKERVILQMQKAFAELDKKINKDWKYVDQHPEKENLDK